MGKNNKLLVPEAREGLDRLKVRVTNTSNAKETKYEIAKELDVNLHKGYNGNLRAKDAGKIGGNIGGKMVQELVKMAKMNLNHK